MEKQITIEDLQKIVPETIKNIRASASTVTLAAIYIGGEIYLESVRMNFKPCVGEEIKINASNFRIDKVEHEVSESICINKINLYCTVA